MTDNLDRLKTALADRYTIEEELGAGGMATVYLAEDLKHHRKVAVKVLRPELAAVLGAERFLKEIEVTANLQHPHILPLFDSGEADSFLYYVMPHIQGESLRDKLNREKQLAIEESVEITKAVASALDYAHRHDVIHRDIKPENILLHEGQPVVADFGIALAVSAAGGTRITETGLSLGTPHYMSPEQATADRELTGKTDIYSLACVIYEMLTGDPPHTGSTAQAIISKVLTEEPRPVTSARKTAPPHVEAAIHRALAKLPADRFPTAQDFASALTSEAIPTQATSAAAGTSTGRRSRVSWTTVGLTALGSLLLGFGLGRTLVSDGDDEQSVLRFRIAVDTDNPAGRRIALSPDGSRVVYVGFGKAGPKLYSRSMDDITPVAIPGTDNGSYPFYSDDGRWLGFATDDGKLMRVFLEGGIPELVTSLRGDFRGATWEEDVIVYSDAGALWRVAPTGGDPEIIVPPDSAGGVLGFRWPDLLPGAEHVLAAVWTGVSDDMWIEAISVASGQRTRLAAGTDARWAEPNHLIFARAGGVLMASPFDIDRLELLRPATPVLSGVLVKSGGAAEISVSRTGVFAYVPMTAVERSLVEVDRRGATRGLTERRGEIRGPNFDPSGDRLVVDIRGPTGRRDIWLLDILDQSSRRLTSGRDAINPSWDPEGRRVAYRSEGTLVIAYVDGSEPPLVITSEGLANVDLDPATWGPNGDYLVFTSTGPTGTGRDLWRAFLGDSVTLTPLLTSEFTETAPAVSPDGRWLAYTSDESGSEEVYLIPLSNASTRSLVSNEGGSDPVWARNTGELFYRNGDRIIAVTARTDPTFRVTGRTQLMEFPAVPGPYWDVHPDGDWFVFVTEPEDTRGFFVVRNWLEELRQRLAGTN